MMKRNGFRNREFKIIKTIVITVQTHHYKDIGTSKETQNLIISLTKLSCKSQEESDLLSYLV